MCRTILFLEVAFFNFGILWSDEILFTFEYVGGLAYINLYCHSCCSTCRASTGFITYESRSFSYSYENCSGKLLLQ